MNATAMNETGRLIFAPPNEKLQGISRRFTYTHTGTSVLFVDLSSEYSVYDGLGSVIFACFHTTTMLRQSTRHAHTQKSFSSLWLCVCVCAFCGCLRLVSLFLIFCFVRIRLQWHNVRHPSVDVCVCARPCCTPKPMHNTHHLISEYSIVWFVQMLSMCVSVSFCTQTHVSIENTSRTLLCMPLDERPIFLFLYSSNCMSPSCCLCVSPCRNWNGNSAIMFDSDCPSTRNDRHSIRRFLIWFCVSMKSKIDCCAAAKDTKNRRHRFDETVNSRTHWTHPFWNANVYVLFSFPSEFNGVSAT